MEVIDSGEKKPRILQCGASEVSRALVTYGFAITAVIGACNIGVGRLVTVTRETRDQLRAAEVEAVCRGDDRLVTHRRAEHRQQQDSRPLRL